MCVLFSHKIKAPSVVFVTGMKIGIISNEEKKNCIMTIVSISCFPVYVGSKKNIAAIKEKKGGEKTIS